MSFSLTYWIPTKVIPILFDFLGLLKNTEKATPNTKINET